jgi:hypothetical protein
MCIVHGIIKRGSLGHSLLDRMLFLRATKYNISGLIFSLFDVSALSSCSSYSLSGYRFVD